MDKKRASELHKWIGIICDSRFSPFIDLKKLCGASIFDEAVNEAIDHATKHGNLTLLNKLLALLDGTPHAHRFLSVVQPRVTCVITDTKPPQLRKTSSQKNIGPVDPLIPKRRTVNVAMAMANRDVEGERSGRDIMDSRLMLPGSYGSGRRR